MKIISLQSSGDYFYLFFLFPTPYTLHPTPHTLHPTPHTPHPTPHTPHPTPHTPLPSPILTGFGELPPLLAGEVD
ncbi:MAG: hypothetical protein ACKN87_06120 [Microcystis aeruginosa]